jgi:hypothetical protein
VVRQPDQPVNREVLLAPLETSRVPDADAEVLGEIPLRPTAIGTQLGQASTDVADDRRR